MLARPILFCTLALLLAAPCGASPSSLEALDTALERLHRDSEFSGAIVIRSESGVVFAKGYGLADPFAGTPFTPATHVDSASLAKPATAAAILLFARDGLLDLDAPVRRYVAEFPYASVTVRQLLAHNAALPGETALAPLDGKTNAQLIAEMRNKSLELGRLGAGDFSYCNSCYNSLALLAERVGGAEYIELLRARLALPRGVAIRPPRLADWKDRAIGYRRRSDGAIERADSYDNERFYGSANFSVNALDLAEWGSRWWKDLAPLRKRVTRRVRMGKAYSGLSIGNWYCAPGGMRCHYPGHHEGFHHMLYWDAGRRLSAALVSNNSLRPALQQRLQRALIAFASGHGSAGSAELAAPFGERPVTGGRYAQAGGEVITITATEGQAAMKITRRGVTYDLFPIDKAISYAPGLDLYISSSPGGRLHLLTLYEESFADPLE